MIYQMRMHFRLPFLQNSPEDKTFPCTPAQFDTFCTLTQLVGAIVIKAQAEHYRRLRGSSSVYCMGALYWQLNDIWEVKRVER